MLNARYVSEHTAQEECSIIFPEYFAGQIFEAKHEPGTIAYSPELQLRLLQETTDEMARNGCKNVVIVNAHAGNEYLLPYFAQSQLYKPHDYVVYVQWGYESGKKARTAESGPDLHAGETETSRVMVTRPNLLHMDRAASESGADQKRVKLPQSVFTGIGWYARFPNHYSGDGTLATQELDETDVGNWVATVVRAIRAIKADDGEPEVTEGVLREKRAPPGYSPLKSVLRP